MEVRGEKRGEGGDNVSASLSFIANANNEL